MIYDFYNYHKPEDNKHIYAFGEKYDSIQFCGFIHANNKTEAQIVLSAHNEAWESNDVLLNYTEEEINNELERRRIVYEKNNCQ